MEVVEGDGGDGAADPRGDGVAHVADKVVHAEKLGRLFGVLLQKKKNTVRPKPFAPSLALKNQKIFHSLAFTIH